ncbi:MAG: hypothetical protein M1467_03965 [Deltaproteobacteria bacterium]|nr:hypothetical protein [Deltaproteobacteria bacterium]
MIKLQENSLRPVKDSIMPALEFSVVRQIVNNQILINSTGNAFTENDKYISALDRVNNIWPDEFQVRIPGIANNRDYNTQSEYVIKFILTLNKELLDYIDNVRQKNSKKDVVLNVKINFIFLQFDLFLYRNADGNVKDILPSNNPNLMMLICNSGSCFKQNSIEESLRLVIKSSDWIQEFAPVLGLGNFLTVEVPILNQEMKIEAHGDFENLSKILNDLVNNGILYKIHSFLVQGEWNKVVEESRKIWEPLQKNKNTITQLISGTTNISEDKANQFVESIDKLYGYSSDLHHSIYKGSIKPSYIGDKSDAYMIYTLLVSIFNMISYKLKNLYNLSKI